MTGVAKSVARLCVGQRRAQFRDVTPSSPAATASFSGLHAATSCQKGTNTNTASLPARCAGHTPNPPRQMRWRWRKLITTIPQKKLYVSERALHSLCVCVREISLPHVRSSCEIDRMRGNGAGTRRGTLGAPERGARFGGGRHSAFGASTMISQGG